MLRWLSLLVLPAALFLVNPVPTFGQPPPPWPRQRGGPTGGDLAGAYINQSNGGQCSIFAQGRSYVFVNENGSRARFVFTGPGQLEQTDGEWDPGVVATVEGTDPRGRITIRFESRNSRPGYWVSAF